MLNYLPLYIHIYPGGLQSMGLQKIRHDWMTDGTCMCIYNCVYVYVCIYIYIFVYIYDLYKKTGKTGKFLRALYLR